jgi:CubicO group peptidase (beta-lactamase class C family)
MNFTATLILALLSQEVPVQTVVAPSEGLAPLRREIFELISERGPPSLTLGVARDGEIVWLEAIGWADRQARRPAETTTLYAVGSMSKSITASAALALVQRGELDHQTRVAELLGPAVRPWDPLGYLEDVRVDDLLASTAGVPHGWVTLSDSKTSIPGCYAGYPSLVAFSPGEVFDYSNNSFGVLQAVIEAKTGRDFEGALQELVFKPLRMTHSTSWLDSTRLESYAVRYTNEGSPLPNEQLMPQGGLGLYASVEDVLRHGMFHLAHLKSNHDGPGSLPIRPGGDPSEGYFRNGWWTTARSHVSNGSIAGANSHLVVLPPEGLVIVVLTNQTSSLADEVADRIRDFLVPAAGESGRLSRARYTQIFRTPYEPEEAWTGRWRGTIGTPCGSVPLELDVEEQVIVRIANDERHLLTNITLNTKGELRGELSGVVPGLTPEGAPEHQIRLMLRLQDGRLSGYASAILDVPSLSASIPAYISLTPVD